jgi:hypothetical protein
MTLHVTERLWGDAPDEVTLRLWGHTQDEMLLLWHGHPDADSPYKSTSDAQVIVAAHLPVIN